MHEKNLKSKQEKKFQLQKIILKLLKKKNLKKEKIDEIKNVISQSININKYYYLIISGLK